MRVRKPAGFNRTRMTRTAIFSGSAAHSAGVSQRVLAGFFPRDEAPVGPEAHAFAPVNLPDPHPAEEVDVVRPQPGAGDVVTGGPVVDRNVAR